MTSFAPYTLFKQSIIFPGRPSGSARPVSLACLSDVKDNSAGEKKNQYLLILIVSLVRIILSYYYYYFTTHNTRLNACMERRKKGRDMSNLRRSGLHA